MAKESEFQKRIGYEGELAPVFEQLTRLYDLGRNLEYSPILQGYEDFNVVLNTEKGKYFIKMFATFRTDEECRKYVEIMSRVLEAGVSHPRLYGHSSGETFEVPANGTKIRGCVMQYVEGKSFYESGETATPEEMRFLERQAAMINSLDIKPRDIYDSWAIVNFLTEFEKNKQYLPPGDVEMIKPVANRFARLKIQNLPHCLVHGDIIKTNVIKDKEDKIYVLDFSVSNHYPRIQELAVLFCNLLFDERNPSTCNDYYKLGLEEYQKYTPLTPEELEALPVFVQAAHVMHIISPIREKVVNGNDSEENDYWLRLGRIGLKYTTQEWEEGK